MIEALLGRKLGMTQIFSETGAVIPVTVIEAGPCIVVKKKTKSKDGYDAVQLGFGSIKEKKLNKAQAGYFAKLNVKPVKYLKEFKTSKIDEYNIGQEIKVDVFKKGDYVDIGGTSKGKGYQGVVKRWGFTGGRNTHGSMFHRAPGSISASSFPSRVFKGSRLPGHMGNAQVTVQKLEVVEINPEKNLLIVKGAVPGTKKGLVVIKRTVKKLKEKKVVIKPKVVAKEEKISKKPTKKKV